MKDMLAEKLSKYESGIVNLASLDSNGTHQICYYNENKVISYFDLYGNINLLS